MKIKQVLTSLFILMGMMSLLGGCSMTKETLTKEQQDNVVRWIARGYEVHAVEFLKLSKNTSTGIYLLSIRVNGDESLETTIPADNLAEFENTFGTVGLNPRNNFQQLEHSEWFPKEQEIDISEIKVHYLDN
ncbi:hypothetical protein [Streptococcus ruminantium]|uniref:Uncharacterized protein n=1 Tax=Streptococcus ruminantium TaxID=1917441 RepID=A0A2Z5TN89_9STRE|nr:hypothetical protein [Streptococcus ruminantium]BBA92800.1 hypothetical protein SR187_5975 [Streptococcus ruminantium]